MDPNENVNLDYKPEVTPSVTFTPNAPAETDKGVPPEDESSGPSKKSKVSIILAVFVLALFGTAYAFWGDSLLRKEVSFNDAFSAFIAAESYSYDMTITVDFPEVDPASDYYSEMLLGEANSMDMKFTNKGWFDRKNTKNIKADNNLDVSVGSINAQVQLLVDGYNIYAKLVKSPSISFLPISLSNYENIWVHFDLEESETANMADMPLQMITGFDSDDLSQISDEQKQKLYDMAKNAKFVKIIDQVDSQEISNIPTKHFTFVLDEVGIKAFFEELVIFVKNDMGKDDSSFASFDTDFLDEMLERYKDFKGEVWIAKKDGLIRKIQVSITTPSFEEGNEGVETTIVGLFDNWGKNFDLNAPEGSITFEELTEKIQQDEGVR